MTNKEHDIKLIECVASLQVALVQAQGLPITVSLLRTMSVMDLLSLIAPNNITFEYTRPANVT